MAAEKRKPRRALEQCLKGLSKESLRELVRKAQALIGSTPGRKGKKVLDLTLRICAGALHAQGLKMNKIHELLAGQSGMPSSPEGIANKLSKVGGLLEMELRYTGGTRKLPDHFRGPEWMLEEQAIVRAAEILDKITNSKR